MATTTSTSNTSIDYVTKDFNSTEDALIAFANTQFGPGTSANRLWTDFNTSSFSRNWLDIVAYISDVFFFYFDNQATQTYLQTATVPSAISNIAKQFGFTPATAQSASGLVSVTFNAAGTYPTHSRLQASTGVSFFTVAPIVATAAGTYQVSVLQGQLNTETFAAQGLQNEEFNLAVKDIVVDQTNAYTAEYSPQVTVNGIKYTLVTTFINSTGADTNAVLDSAGTVIGGGGRVFQLSQRADGTQYIQFGDGTFGRQLTPNAVVNVIYRSGGGSSGNIAAKTLTTLVDTFNFITGVTNTAAFSGGADAQTNSQLQQLIPASLRTLDRAVSEQDYSEILTLNFPQVLQASTEANLATAGVDLNIYVVPTASTVTSITANSTLRTTLNNFLNLRKMVTVQFQILDAYGLPILISLEVHLASTTNQAVTSAAIKTALQNYFNLQTGGESGTGIGFATPVLIEDISAILKTITGIERFEFRRFTYRPRIDQNVVGLTTTYSNSDVEVFKNVSKSEWLIAASGPVTETSGSVLFNNSNNTNFTYDSATGKVTYTGAISSLTAPQTLTGVAPGDLFRNASDIPGLNQKVSIQTVPATSGGVKEVTQVTTVADIAGLSEITEILTVANVSSFLKAKYFLLQDSAGSVAVYFGDVADQPNAILANRFIRVPITNNDTDVQIATNIATAVNADAAFTVTSQHNTVQIILDAKKAVTKTTDGLNPTNFTFIRLQAGLTPQSLNNKYFDIYDSVGIVRAWYNVSGAGVAPTQPGTEPLLQIAISSNATAAAVAAATSAAFAAYSGTTKFTASYLNNVVTIADASVGVRTNSSDTGATGFTITTITEGAPANSLGGKYFDLYDSTVYVGVTNPTNLVRVWFNTGSSTPPTVVPANGERLLPVSILTSDTSNQVATKLKAALAADAQFTNSTVISSTVTAVNTYTGYKTNPSAGTSTFTVTILQRGTMTADYIILGVDSANSTLYLAPNQPFSGTPVGGVYTLTGAAGGAGSIRTGQSTYESFRVFKKINAVASNLSVNSITDNTLDLSTITSTGVAISDHLLLDNTQALIPNAYAGGDYYLEDSNSNIWEIVANDSDSISTGPTAINDSIYTSVSSGTYKIIKKLTSYQVLFNKNIFTINYNTHNTIYSIGAQFSNIGTIGNAFQISKQQANVGSIGTYVDLISYDSATGLVKLNGQPDLSYISANDFLTDSSGQIFRLTAIDNRAQPLVTYDTTHYNSSIILTGAGQNSQIGQGFQVLTTAKYPIVSLYLRREGNISGNLLAKIYTADGSQLPTGTAIATSEPLNVNTLSESFTTAVFTFTVPPTLNSATQYVLVLVGDSSSAYTATQKDNIKTFDNTAAGYPYSYNSITGVVQYLVPLPVPSTSLLANVVPGNYIKDLTGNYFKVLSVNTSLNTVTLATGLVFTSDPGPTIANGSGSIYAKDNVYLGYDASINTYPSGNLELYGPLGWAKVSPVATAIFSVAGPKSITVKSNLTPTLGAGATISSRYYDDENQISFILGLTAGLPTYATDVNALGKGTVASVTNSIVDNFVFRTSPYLDDIVNLRNNEIPQLNVNDLQIQLFGGT